MQSPMQWNTLLAQTGWVRALSLDLLGDAQRADDVTQETLLSALKQPGTNVWSEGRLRAWLGQVVRNAVRTKYRSDSRRRQREERSAAHEAQPSVADAVERVELQRRTATAVMALGSPEREIVTLRYFEDLPVVEIAQRLGLSPGAVHSRLSRARASLRDRLERDYSSEQRHWSAVALAWVGRPDLDPAALTLLGVGGIGMKFFVVASGLALIALTALLAFDAEAPLEPVGTLAQNDVSAELATPAGVPVAPVERGAKVELREVAAPRPDASVEPEPVVPPAEVGSVRVVVLDARGQPVPGVSVTRSAVLPTHAWFHQERRLTNDAGQIDFKAAPGKHEFELRRVGALTRSVEVGASESHELEFVLEDGDVVRGRVIDYAGRPVAAAAIWLGDGLGPPDDGNVVTHTDERGEFRIPHIHRLQAVAARAPGYAPSFARMPLFFEKGGDEIEVELVLPGVGGRIDGVVVDPQGAPVAGALVLVGNALLGNVTQLEDKPAYDAPRIQLRTDARGRFVAQGLPRGSVKVAARSLGTDLVQLEVEVEPNATTQARIVLGAPGRVVGTLRRADGRVVAGARVHLEHPLRLMARASATTRAEGEFELGGVPTGRVTLIAELPSEGLAVRGEVEVFAGEESSWEPRFPGAYRVTGRVVDERGQALAGWLVRREAATDGEQESEMSRGSVETDAQGEFTLDGCEDVAQTITVCPPGQWFAEAVVEHTVPRPGGEALTLTVANDDVPNGQLEGRVCDAAGVPLVGCSVRLQAPVPDFVLVRGTTDEDGVFRIANLAARRYQLELEAEGFVPRELDAVDLPEADASVDLGQLVLSRAE